MNILLFLGLLCCGSDVQKEVAIEMKLPQRKDITFEKREQLLKEIFNKENLLRILLRYLDKNLLTICGSFVNKKMLKIYKEEMDDQNLTDSEIKTNKIFPLNDVLLLSATHFRFNIAFQENIKQDNPNLTIARGYRNQVRTKALESEGGNNLADPLIALPQQYADLVNKAIKIRSNGHDKVKKLRKKFVVALGSVAFTYLLLLILTSSYASLLVTPFGSVANEILRTIVLLIFLYIRVSCVPPQNIFGVFSIIISMSLIIITLNDTSSILGYVLNMFFISYYFLPMFCVLALNLCEFALYQSFKEFIVEKKKMKRKDQKLKKVLFIQ